MTIKSELADTVVRVSKMIRLAHSVESHLLADQAEAVAPGVPSGNRGAGNEISDPTYRATRALAPFAKWERDLFAALRSVGSALDDAERTFQVVLNESGRHARGVQVDAEERCPGWNDELRAQLGGCGKVLERYRDTRGVEHVRSTRLCVGCRKARERAEREAEDAA